MKKLFTVLLAIMLLLLTGCTQIEVPQRFNADPYAYWWGEQNDTSLSVHLMPDRDGMLPFDTNEFMWQRHENLSENLTSLDGGEYRQGAWSDDGQTLTLTFDNGEVMKGTYCAEGLLLEYDGGFLLNHCKYTLPD